MEKDLKQRGLPLEMALQTAADKAERRADFAMASFSGSDRTEVVVWSSG